MTLTLAQARRAVRLTLIADGQRAAGRLRRGVSTDVKRDHERVKRALRVAERMLA